jgi:hypothetical protein
MAGTGTAWTTEDDVDVRVRVTILSVQLMTTRKESKHEWWSCQAMNNPSIQEKDTQSPEPTVQALRPPLIRGDVKAVEACGRVAHHCDLLFHGNPSDVIIDAGRKIQGRIAKGEPSGVILGANLVPEGGRQTTAAPVVADWFADIHSRHDVRWREKKQTEEEGHIS